MNNITDLAAASLILAIIAMVFVRLLGVFLGAALFIAIACVAILTGANADTLEVSAVIESEMDRATMEDAATDAAAIFKDQLGVDLVVTYTEVGSIAGHTHAYFLLDAVGAYRMDHAQHSAADATVLFTRRDIRVGTTDYIGIATTGPACSANASVVMEIRGDGYDGALLAHELLHTVGVPHDATPGWLMSESLSRVMSRTISQDAILTFRAAGLGKCVGTTAANPPSAAGQTPPAAPSTGGGGAMDGPLFFVLLILLAVWRQVRKVTAECDAQRRVIKSGIERVMLATGWTTPRFRKIHVCNVCGEPGCPDHGMG